MNIVLYCIYNLTEFRRSSQMPREGIKGTINGIRRTSKGGNVKSYTDKNVVSGKKYTYTVKAYIICPAGYISGGYNKTGVTITVK